MKRSNFTLRNQSGFTIVELLVIVVVVGILAAISVVGYTNVRNSAIRETLRSDVQEAASQLEKERQKIGIYPTDASTVNSGKGLVASDGNTVRYIKISDKAYCLMISSSNVSIEPVHQVSGNTKVQNGACPVTVANKKEVTEFVGATTSGYQNGSGATARFSTSIAGIAIDDSGTLYVADYLGNRIRKITAEGEVSLFAGSGVGASVDGTGAAAQFHGPCGIAIDGKGFVYVADSNSGRIRKITPTGVVTTLAGGGSAGYVNATGAAARFSSPCGIAAESSGVLYVADSNNHSIRRVSTSGEVTTFAGSTSGVSGTSNGTGTAARFSNPLGIARDVTGALYVTDSSTNNVRKISTSAVVETLAVPALSGPRGIAVNAVGDLYVADYGNNRVRRITSAGAVDVLAGSGSAGWALGNGTAAQLSSPIGIAVNRHGTVYVTSSSLIRKID